MSELVYLASPYSVKAKVSYQRACLIRAQRYREVCKFAAHLMKQGRKVFCPIAHSHPIETLGMGGEIMDGDFWLNQDYAVLQNCTELMVYMMDGWEQSYGINEEIKFAKEHGIPITYQPKVSFTRKYEMIKPNAGAQRRILREQREAVAA